MENLERDRKFSGDVPILDQNEVQPLFLPLSLEIQDRPVLSFTEIMTHNAHRLRGRISSMFPRLRKKWASLQGIAWSVHLRDSVSYFRTYIVYICIFKTPLISLFIKDFFPSSPALLQTSVWKTRQNLCFFTSKHFLPTGIGISCLRNGCPLLSQGSKARL